MRKEQDSDDGSLLLVLVALVLMIAVIAAMAERHGGTSQDDRFVSVEPGGNNFGFTSPLLAPADPQIRINELPQVQ